MKTPMLIALLGAALAAHAGDEPQSGTETEKTEVRIVRLAGPDAEAPVDDVARELRAKLRAQGIDEDVIERVVDSVKTGMQRAWKRLPAEARADADGEAPRIRVHVAEPVVTTHVERIEDFDGAPAEVRRRMRLLVEGGDGVAVAPLGLHDGTADPQVREAIEGVRRAQERLQRALAKRNERAAPEATPVEQRLDRLEAKLARIERLLDEALASDG